MTDIVERLRIPVDHQDDWIIGADKLMNEAAAEIERLRAKIKKLEDTMEDLKYDF